jgi:D-serine ammonia-lyase
MTMTDMSGSNNELPLATTGSSTSTTFIACYNSGTTAVSCHGKQKIKTLKDLITPSFIINRYTFANNCSTMIDTAKRNNVTLRPHMKTHKTIQGCYAQATGTNWNKERGNNNNSSSDNRFVTGFVASTLPEIYMLARNNNDEIFHTSFLDVLYGVPICQFKLPYIEQLRKQFRTEREGTIHIIVDHIQQVEFIEKFISHNNVDEPFSVFLKLDTGYHRAGVPCTERGIQLASRILSSSSLMLKGVYSHWYV